MALKEATMKALSIGTQGAKAQAAQEIRMAILSHTEQAGDLLALFEAWDQNDDGRVAPDEFVEGILAIGLSNSADDARDAFALFDADGTGELTMHELKTQIDLGRKSLLNTQAVGLGAGASDTLALMQSEALKFSWSNAVVEISTLIAILLVAPIGVVGCIIYDQQVGFGGDGSLLIPEQAFWPLLVVDGVAVVIISTALSFVVARRMDAVPTSKPPSWSDTLCAMCKGRTLAICILVLSLQSYKTSLHAIDAKFTPEVHYYYRLTYMLAFFTSALTSISVVDRGLKAFAEREGEVFRTSRPRRTQISMMKGNTLFGKAEQNAAYGFSNYKSAPDVVYSMWSVIRVLGKAIATLLFVTFYFTAARDSGSDEPEYAWSPIFFFLVILTGSVLVFLGLSAASVRNVLHIAIAKPFFLGDIIHIHTANAPGGIGESITGFVENFTFAHIVIRSFDMKQVWVTHEHFETLTVSNWTRRPNKCVSYKFTIRSTESPAAVTALLKFVKGWVNASEDVKQNGYKKIAVTGMDPGYVITVIFFTALGASKKKMREKLLLDTMAAATRLGVTLVPTELPTNQYGLATVGSTPEPERALQNELMELLPKPATGKPSKGDTKDKETKKEEKPAAATSSGATSSAPAPAESSI